MSVTSQPRCIAASSCLCVTRGRSIRAEVIRLIGQELAAVDDIEVALGAVLGPTPKRR